MLIILADRVLFFFRSYLSSNLLRALGFGFWKDFDTEKKRSSAELKFSMFIFKFFFGFMKVLSTKLDIHWFTLSIRTIFDVYHSARKTFIEAFMFIFLLFSVLPFVRRHKRCFCHDCTSLMFLTLWRLAIYTNYFTFIMCQNLLFHNNLRPALTYLQYFLIVAYNNALLLVKIKVKTKQARSQNKPSEFC